ncbi:N-terminal acetyltransferase A auxiliary subunit with TPR repeat [Cryptosporidium hominis]|uniref:N-terminal acetyltransferase A auxiliary subunit with TPR repeat n=2 Tax=Cryptosporidium hominis TaxID=237895 RepID=A0ABX5BD75_CRYHO|nr:N-terminal acetyltransferase A auxiliary subunit with TPR repeat [Cryptosporidium hominis]|eukprot:PPS94787.1 N-terminal acetyltransferase A auxiliary subunit with TPR repeat [Cryptosporidium hominis]
MSKEIPSLATLSTRDQQQFKNIVQLYDQRIYKRSLKLTETMLKKYPKQGDLLSMKAFILGAMHPESKDEKHKEAYECAKEAIKQNMKNPMSWHCLGTLYKGDFDYNEAIKCFKTALKFDKEDLVVLRDLATCLIQIRNYQGFRDIRNEIKRIRPDIRTNWIASALGNHFCGYINSAINCLLSIDQFGSSENGNIHSKRTSLDENNYGVLFSFLEPFQRSELLLYFVRVLLDGKKYQQAYNFLRSNKEFILDKTDYYNIMGNLLVKCNQNYTKECSECFNNLLELYPDDDYALFGCMITNKSLNNVVLSPPHLPAHQIKGFRLQESEDESVSSGNEAVIPICSIGSNFFHTRGTSGIIYYPLLTNDNIGRNKHFEHKRLNSKEIECDYGYKASSNITNPVLEFIIYEDFELAEKKVEYENSLRKIEQFFQEKKSQFPNSDTILRIELAFSSGEEFLRKFRIYLKSKLKSRITALKSLIGYLIKLDSKKKFLIHSELNNIVSEYENLYEKGEADKDELITLYLIYSQHLDCIGLSLEGLNYIEKALKLDDKKPDAFNIKRRLLKHLYRFDEATNAINHARLMDINDRYLNTRTICACLENGDFNEAKELLKKYITRISDQSKSKESEVVPSNETEIKNLQMIWYEKRVVRSLELFDSSIDGYVMTFDHYLRLLDSMEIMKTDQYDYHLYCLRKMTLCRYLDFINMQDKLFCNTNYRKISVIFWRKIWINIYKIVHGKLELAQINYKKDKQKNKNKGGDENESLKETLEFVKDPEQNWSKSHEIIQNYRKDCIFNTQSYIPIYIHYYCSQKILGKLSMETCILVCSKSIYRVYTLENSYIRENQIGVFPILLTHFYTKIFNNMKNGIGNISKDYRNNILDAIIKQLQIFTGIENLNIDNINTHFQNYISYMNFNNINDIESLCNLVKISIITGTFNNIESYLDNFDNIDNLNKFSGIFNQQIINLVKLLIIRSIISNNSDTESLNLNSSNFSIENYSFSKSKLLNKIINSYDINSRKFVTTYNQQNHEHKFILQVKYLKDQISKEIIEISNLPILALSI